ncbi:MAG: hypothetical protein ACI9DQ_001231, partial [Glaciecola sp.]
SAVTQTLRSNFDRPTGDPKGEALVSNNPARLHQTSKKAVPLGAAFLLSDSYWEGV